jgi:ABC-type transport system involved in cytochrome c biogenesis permease subunit
MIRIFFIVVLAGLVAIAGGLLMLGVFPPPQQPHPVEKVVPNDKFTTH